MAFIHTQLNRLNRLNRLNSCKPVKIDSLLALRFLWREFHLIFPSKVHPIKEVVPFVMFLPTVVIVPGALPLKSTALDTAYEAASLVIRVYH